MRYFLIVLLTLFIGACSQSSQQHSQQKVHSKKPHTYEPYICNKEKYEQFKSLRIYQVMTEAFINGNPKIGYGTGYGSSHHMGDLAGITQSLDYIKELGMNAIWLTPVFESVEIEGQSHWITRLDATGYFPSNYFNIDPNFGSMDDARQLVDAAHERGIYVFFDGVFGHRKTNAVEYASPSGKVLSSTGPEYAAGLDTTQKSLWPDDLEYYKEVATYWIKELKIDGWRLDVANELPTGAWGEIRKAVEEASASTTYEMNDQQVNPLGFMVAEMWDGSGRGVRQKIYGKEEAPGLCSSLDFASRYPIVKTFAGEESGTGNYPAYMLEEAFKLNAHNPVHAVPTLFIGNHDLLRFGDLLQRIGAPESEYWLRHKAAYSFLSAQSGPIVLYYGDEIGDEVPDFVHKLEPCHGDSGMCDDHVARSSGKIEALPIGKDGKIFRANAKQQELRAYISQLMQLRSEHSALYRGTRTHIEANKQIFADLKQDESSKILYVVNASSKDYKWKLDASKIGNTQILHELTTKQEFASSNGQYQINIPAWTGYFLQLK